MPRTASKESPSRPIPRGRSSAWSQPPVDKPKVPVLFRLPIIEQAAVVAGDDADFAEELSNQGERLQSQTPAAGFDPAEIASRMQTLQQTVTPEVVVQPTAAVETAPAAPAAPVEQRTVEQRTVEQRKVEVATSGSSHAPRSWWEHWSSGVVLILLVIALVTASIIAFNDAGKIDTEPMADLNSEFALNSIEIPDVQIPDVQVPDAGISASATQTTSPAFQADVPVESPQVESPTMAQATLPAIPSPTESMDSTTPNLEAPAMVAAPVEENQELVLDAFPEPAKDAESLIPNTLELPASEPGLALEAPVQNDSPMHSATLMRPVAEQERQLFAPNSAVQPGLPAHPAGMQMTEKAKPGASPSLYDGADVATSREGLTLPNATPQPNAPAMDQPNIVDTNLPAMETLLGNAGAGGPYRQVSQSSGSAQANFAVASHQATVTSDAPNASAAVPATASPTGVVETSTPQSNIDALLRKWQQFKAMSEPGNVSNRYPNN